MTYEKVVGGKSGTCAGVPADRNEERQVSQVFRSMASLVGVVRTPSSKQRYESCQVWELETLFQIGPCNKIYCKLCQP